MKKIQNQTKTQKIQNQILDTHNTNTSRKFILIKNTTYSQYKHPKNSKSNTNQKNSKSNTNPENSKSTTTYSQCTSSETQTCEEGRKKKEKESYPDVKKEERKKEKKKKKKRKEKRLTQM